MGADPVVDFRVVDPVEEFLRLTDGRGVDVATFGSWRTLVAGIFAPSAATLILQSIDGAIHA